MKKQKKKIKRNQREIKKKKQYQAMKTLTLNK